MRTFQGTFTLPEFYGWLNPEGMPHAEKYSRTRLLSSYVEVDEETYWYFLEMLPPMYFTGSQFAICEATTDDIRLGFFEIMGRHFAAHVSDRDQPNKMGAVRDEIAQAQSATA